LLAKESNVAKYLETLEKIKVLEADVFIPAHAFCNIEISLAKLQDLDALHLPKYIHTHDLNENK
jgi:hypothetical protein